MSSSEIGLPDATLQTSQNSISLNSVVTSTLLIGVYTMVYLGTLHIYLTKMASQRALIVITITLLYILTMTNFALQWYLLKWQFIDNGDTRETVFMAFYNIPLWYNLAIAISSYLVILLADGLLIWRSFHVWNRSLRIIVIPCALLLGEAGLFVSTVILGSITISEGQDGLIKYSDKLNSIQSSLFFVSAGTSISATYLIAHRIYAVSKRDDVFTNHRFNQIIEILIQSAAVYAFALLVSGIATVIPQPEQGFPSSKIFALLSYSGALLVPISGIAPTLMVARVALVSNAARSAEVSTRHHLSGLQFNKPLSQVNHHNIISGASGVTNIESSIFAARTRHSQVDERVT